MSEESVFELASRFRKTIAEIIVRIRMKSAENQFIAHQILVLVEM
jgi:hypothetical protein